MVSSTTVLSMLPSCSGNTESPHAASPESGREPENALSFATRLDQRLSRPEPARETRRPQSRLPDAPLVAQETNAASDSLDSSEMPVSEAAPRPDRSEPGDDNAKSEDTKSSDGKTDTKAAPLSPVPLPLTPDALNAPAFLAAVAVVPATPIVPTPTPAAPSNLPIVAAVANGVSVVPTTNPVPANPASAEVNVAKGVPVAPTNSPIIPTVATDSRAANLVAPGIANAAPLLSNVASTPAPNASPAANANLAAPTTQNGLTNLNNVSGLNETTSATQTAVTAIPNPLAVVIAPDDLSGANKATAPLTASAGTPQPPNTTAASITGTGITAALPSGKPELTAPIAAENSTAQSVAQAPSTLEGDNAPTVSAGKQNLDSIERLLTLSNAKTASLASEVVAKTAESTAVSLTDAAPVTPLLRSNAAVTNTTAAQIGVPTAVNTTLLAAPASTDHTSTVPSTTLLVPASADFGSVVKPAAITQALLHGLPGGLETIHPASASASNSSGVSIGAGGVSSLVSIAQSANFAGSGAEEQGQKGAQSQANEQGLSSETESANTAGVGTASAFAITSAATDAPAAAQSQSASTVKSSQMERAHVVAQVTRHLEMMRLTNGGGEMRLRLNPHNLGSVHVTVAAHQDGVIARIAVESAQVQQAMEGAKEHLRAGLEARGLRVQSVEVTVTPNALDNNSAAYSGQRNWQPATAQESAAWQTGYGRRTTPNVETASAVVPATILPRALAPDSRLDCRA